MQYERWGKYYIIVNCHVSHSNVSFYQKLCSSRRNALLRSGKWWHTWNDPLANPIGRFVGIMHDFDLNTGWLHSPKLTARTYQETFPKPEKKLIFQSQCFRCYVMLVWGRVYVNIFPCAPWLAFKASAFWCRFAVAAGPQRHSRMLSKGTC